MCSANATHFLEALLQVPSIDINKSDNELNTPLHYASECGKFIYLANYFLHFPTYSDIKCSILFPVSQSTIFRMGLILILILILPARGYKQRKL